MTNNNPHSYVDDLFEGGAPSSQETQKDSPATEILEPDNALIQLRTQLGLSQQDVACAMGVSESSVKQIETSDLNDAKLGALVSYVEGCGYNLELALTPTA